MLACTGPSPEVVIETHIGEQQARREAEGARAAAVTIADSALRWWDEQRLVRVIAPVDPDGDDDEPDTLGPRDNSPAPPIAYDPTPAKTREQLFAQLEALREGPMDEVGLITRNLAFADPGLWPEIRDELLAERKRPKREYKQVLAVIGGDVPNRYGHFNLHWKLAHGYDVRVSEDWFEDLLALEARPDLQAPAPGVSRDPRDRGAAPGRGQPDPRRPRAGRRGRGRAARRRLRPRRHVPR